MTNPDARAMVSHHEYEAQLRATELSTKIFNIVARTYSDYIINSGLSKTVNYGSYIAGGALLITVAPAGLLGISIGLVGMTIAGYGLVGAGAYATDTASFVAGRLYGNSYKTSYGNDFEALYGLKPSDRQANPNQSKTDDAIDYFIDKTIETGLHAAGHLGKASLSVGIDELNKLFESILKETDKILEDLHREEMEKINKSKTQPQIQPSRSENLKLINAQNDTWSNDGILNSHGHLNTDGGIPWAGNDQGTGAPSVSDIA